MTHHNIIIITLTNYLVTVMKDSHHLWHWHQLVLSPTKLSQYWCSHVPLQSAELSCHPAHEERVHCCHSCNTTTIILQHVSIGEYGSTANVGTVLKNMAAPMVLTSCRSSLTQEHHYCLSPKSPVFVLHLLSRPWILPRETFSLSGSPARYSNRFLKPQDVWQVQSSHQL